MTVTDVRESFALTVSRRLRELIEPFLRDISVSEEEGASPPFFCVRLRGRLRDQERDTGVPAPGERSRLLGRAEELLAALRADGWILASETRLWLNTKEHPLSSRPATTLDVDLTLSPGTKAADD
jgi:hypothetical protein